MMRSRMNRNNSVVLAVAAAMAVCLMLVTSAMALPEWDVEWWSGETETNPYTNEVTGATWGIYEGHSSYDTPERVTDWSTYKPMTWLAADSQWGAETSDYLRYMSFKKSLDGRLGAPGALTFEPPASLEHDLFSLYGKPLLRFDYTELYIGILDDSDAFTELYYAATGVGNTTLDLGAVEALQNVRLGAGERIAFISHSSEHASAHRTRVQFDTTDYGGETVGISLIPEPATGVLFLGMLSLVALRRRRRRG